MHTTTQPRPGEEIELRIESLAFGGAGVAKRDGFVVFVHGAVPGDRVRAIVGKSKRAYAEARAVHVLEAGRERIPPRAEHPGVPWQILPYQRQLEAKQAQVEEALARIGRVHATTLEPIVAAVDQWRYRNKLEYSFGSDESGRLICGFHEPGRWDRIVEVRDCLLASEEANALRERIVEWCRSAGLRAHDRRSGDGVLRNLVVREGRRTKALQARLVTTPEQVDRESLARAAGPQASILWTRLEGVAETTQGGETEVIAGSELLDEVIAGVRLRASPGAFLQTNTEMADRLYALAVEYAQCSGFERVYDLYCGIGTISLAIAPRAAEVWGLELVPEAIADAIASARHNEIHNARFFAGDVRLALRELVATAGPPDVLIVDPPRAGLSQKVVRRIIEAGPSRIVYVSCNPTTLAPNVAQLTQAGYELARVRPVDMFPQTPHIECVALLVRP
jgi:23S rRNA (uracil1939-C5)-methyltransferase